MAIVMVPSVVIVEGDMGESGAIPANIVELVLGPFKMKKRLQPPNTIPGL
jgi:hypothetical protein